jgi:hypothetical protein
MTLILLLITMPSYAYLTKEVCKHARQVGKQTFLSPQIANPEFFIINSKIRKCRTYPLPAVPDAGTSMPD